MKVFDVFKESVLFEFIGLVSDFGGELLVIGNYDIGDVKGFLDNVDKDKIKELVERVKFFIFEYYEKVKKVVMDVFNEGKI